MLYIQTAQNPTAVFFCLLRATIAAMLWSGASCRSWAALALIKWSLTTAAFSPQLPCRLCRETLCQISRLSSGVKNCFRVPGAHSGGAKLVRNGSISLAPNWFAPHGFASSSFAASLTSSPVKLVKNRWTLHPIRTRYHLPTSNQCLAILIDNRIGELDIDFLFIYSCLIRRTQFLRP